MSKYSQRKKKDVCIFICCCFCLVSSKSVCVHVHLYLIFDNKLLCKSSIRKIHDIHVCVWGEIRQIQIYWKIKGPVWSYMYMYCRKSESFVPSPDGARTYFNFRMRHSFQLNHLPTLLRASLCQKICRQQDQVNWHTCGFWSVPKPMYHCHK